MDRLTISGRLQSENLQRFVLHNVHSYRLRKRTICLGAASRGERSVQMPVSIRQQVEQIRAYAAMAAAEAHGSQTKELVTLLHRSADDLETTARLMFAAMGPDPPSKPLWPLGSG